MLATVSLRKLGQDCVLSGPWLCRELSWISDLQGRVWAAAAPCGPARPRARPRGKPRSAARSRLLPLSSTPPPFAP